MNSGIKNLDFEDVYESLRLNTVHRHFGGTDSSLIAVFCLFELLHNLRDFVNKANGKRVGNDWAERWYRTAIDQAASGYTYARPEVYQYIFGRKRLSKKAKNRILEDAKKELSQIMESTGIERFIKNLLEGKTMP